MSIEGIKSSALYHPITATQQRERGLSKTDWKTHTLVVLSYLLIGIGFGLACGAVYIALTIHPMIAMASPVLPIALGILGLQYAAGPDSKLFDIVGTPHTTQTPSVGISNAGANCWINASLQLLFNVPAFRKAMENLNEQSESILQKAKRVLIPNSGIYPVLDAFRTYQQDEKDKKGVSLIDSQKIREWLHQHNSRVSLEVTEPELPTDYCLKFILNRMSFFLPNETEKVIDRKDNEILSINSLMTEMSYIDLTGDLDQANTKNLNVALNHYFNQRDVLPSGNIRQTNRCLEKTPDDLSIARDYTTPVDGQNGYQGGMVKTKLEGAMEVSLTAAQVGEDARYLCDGFICHEGVSIDNGHYIAYLFKDGSWWEASDAVVRKISLKEANNKLALAVFMHYQKTETAIQQN